ncbi:MAG: outer membrane beta-barrel protein [Treponema sp.]|nr:outer membrane beta-barrel protein [Treponema sp.]MBR5032115.1 outer membrane beta-barrel protein [Treponema sp.]
MKKIIAMAVAAVMMVSAASALDLEFGARAILGRNLDSGTFKENMAQAKQDKTYDFGFGVYGNFALFGGLGIQAEANYVKSSITFAKEGKEEVQYDMHTLDLSPMLWLNLDLWKFTLGFGVGPNFEIPLASLGDIKNAKKQDFTVGLIAGADFKFYFTDHLGLVLSGRYVTDWQTKDVPIEVNGYNSGATYPSYEFTRKSIYGGLGLEWKII